MQSVIKQASAEKSCIILSIVIFLSEYSKDLFDKIQNFPRKNFLLGWFSANKGNAVNLKTSTLAIECMTPAKRSVLYGFILTLVIALLIIKFGWIKYINLAKAYLGMECLQCSQLQPFTTSLSRVFWWLHWISKVQVEKKRNRKSIYIHFNWCQA